MQGKGWITTARLNLSEVEGHPAFASPSALVLLQPRMCVALAGVGIGVNLNERQ
jgi:hypothetical protein